MIYASCIDLRKRLAHYMQRANDDRDAILITRQGSEPVVMLALSEWEGMQARLRRSFSVATFTIDRVEQS